MQARCKPLAAEGEGEGQEEEEGEGEAVWHSAATVKMLTFGETIRYI